jgi:Tfp pilus assembly protein PilF
LKINPKNERTRYQLASIRLAQGKLDQARHHFEKLTESEPSFPGIYFHLGIVYEKLGMPEKAENAYEKALMKNPDNAEACNNLGLLLAKKGELRALSLYQKAIEIKPDLAPAHLNLASAYYLLKDYGLSRKHALIAKKLSRPEADALIRKLDAVSKAEKVHTRRADEKSP